MLTVIGMDDAELKNACEQAAARSGKIVQISNFLFPKGLVVGGEPEGIAALQQALSNQRGLIVRRNNKNL